MGAGSRQHKRVGIDKLIGHLQPLPNLDKPWLLGHSSQISCLGFTDSGQAYKMTEGLVQE